jgi:hypothetical protein
MLPDDDADFDWAFLPLFLKLFRMESFQIELSLRQMLQEVTGEERRGGRSQS